MMFDPDKWAVWHFRATIVNDAGASGSHEYLFTPGAGNVLILLGGSLLNGDTSTRVGLARLRNTDADIIRQVLENSSVVAGATRDFPTSQSTGDNLSASDGSPVVVAGTEDFLVGIVSVAVSENTEVSIQFLVSGGPPTVTFTSPASAVETETENRIV